MSQIHTSPASIAAALRRAADDLDKAGDTQLSPVNLHLNLQAVSYCGTADERKSAVDALCVALTGTVGYTETDEDPHHRLSYEATTGARNDMDVSVYTAVKDFTPGGAR